jgi:hypothetical protein
LTPPGESLVEAVGGFEQREIKQEKSNGTGP